MRRGELVRPVARPCSRRRGRRGGSPPRGSGAGRSPRPRPRRPETIRSTTSSAVLGSAASRARKAGGARDEVAEVLGRRAAGIGLDRRGARLPRGVHRGLDAGRRPVDEVAQPSALRATWARTCPATSRGGRRARRRRRRGSVRAVAEEPVRRRRRARPGCGRSGRAGAPGWGRGHGSTLAAGSGAMGAVVRLSVGPTNLDGPVGTLACGGPTPLPCELTEGPSVADRLIVRGAREHNLKDVSLDLPRDALIVFTGLSGSGKSSLAFDTIFAEGQRRYVESLSAYARQFLGQMDKPDVDFIEGLSPAVSIDQKSTNRNPRSTVGTITEVYDYLRLLYARAGRPHCPDCGAPHRPADPAADRRPGARARRGTRFQVLAPVVRGRKGEYVELFSELQAKGYTRARVDGVVHTAHRAARAEEAGEAHHRGGRRPARGQGRRQAPAHRLGRDRAGARRRPGRPRLRRPARGRPAPRAAVLRAPGLPLRRPVASRSSSRGRSRSTARTAPAPSAPASAPGWRSTPSWSSPTRR